MTKLSYYFDFHLWLEVNQVLAIGAGADLFQGCPMGRSGGRIPTMGPPQGPHPAQNHVLPNRLGQPGSDTMGPHPTKPMYTGVLFWLGPTFLVPASKNEHTQTIFIISTEK